MITTRSALDRMAAQTVPTRGQLERTAPAGEREHGLVRILAETPPWTASGGTARRSWLPPLVAVAVLVTVLAVALVTVPALRGAPPATPAAGTVATVPPTVDPTTAGSDAATLLRHLADRAAAQPPRTDQGPYQYGHFQRWSLNIKPDADGKLGPVGVTTDIEFWRSADRSGRIVTTETGQPQLVRGLLPDPGLQLPADPAALEGVLSRYRVGPPSADSWFGVVAGVGMNEVLDPPVQAALLRLLATQGDMTVDGPVTDRAGRAGIAVTTRPTLDSGEEASTEHTLVLDPDTGAVLAEEHVDLATRDGVPTEPTTVMYVLGLGVGRVDAIGQRP